jgi:transmembrane sensor
MVISSSRPRVVVAEAAAWVARLQATPRDAATEAALKSWLGADAENRDAFERATEIWAIIPGAAAIDRGYKPGGSMVRERRADLGSQPSLRRNFALAASLLLVLAGSVWVILGHRPATYVTRAGEQEVAALADGSRVALNTETAIQVDYKPDVRRITLEHGEAMFDVAHNMARPFIVDAGNTQVRAVGTSFIVRRIDDDVQVILLKGRVAVSAVKAGRSAGSATPTMLDPGERLTADKDVPAAIDNPSMEVVTAWRRGQVVFDEIPLASAAAELGRYGGPRITVADPRLAATPVSGVFATNDAAEFAAAVAKLHGWRVEQAGDELRISR